MTKIYSDGTSRCKDCYRLFWPTNKTELVCNNCLKNSEPENIKREIIVENNNNNLDYWTHLNKLTDMLKNCIFF